MLVDVNWMISRIGKNGGRNFSKNKGVNTFQNLPL